MAMYFDIGIAIILIVGLAAGVKHGILCKIAGIASVVISLTWAGRFAEYFAPRVEQLLQNNVLGRLEMVLQGDRSADAGQMLQILGFNGSDLSAMAESVTEQARQSGEELINAVVYRVSYSEAYALVYIVALLALVFLFGMLIKLLKKVKIPGIDQIDSMLGGVLGLLEGALVVFLLVWALGRFRSFITPDVIADSTFLKFFVENTPASLIKALTGNTIL